MKALLLTLILTLAAASVMADEWRPIETAPRDGSLILISAGVDSHGQKLRWTYIGYWADQMPGSPKEWYGVDTNRPIPRKAFKWMPLPREMPQP